MICTFAFHYNYLSLFCLGGSSSSRVSSPNLMVFALLFLNMTFVCRPNSNPFTINVIINITKKMKPKSLHNIIIVLKEKQKQIKRLYQNLPSYLSIPLLSITFARLTRRMSKRHNLAVVGLSSTEQECKKTIYNTVVNYESTLRKR